jgi:DNA-binding MarR family transcriptional regulator
MWWNMVRSLPSASELDSLDNSIASYIVSNVMPTESVARADRLDHVATHLVSRAALLVRLLVKQVPLGDVSRTEGEVLGILEEGRRRITELAELAGLAQPTVTLLVRRLEERGWVLREGLPDDGRVVMVRLTEAGKEMFERFRGRFTMALRADLEGLPDEQLAELLAATETLGSLVQTLRTQTEADRPM